MSVFGNWTMHLECLKWFDENSSPEGVYKIISEYKKNK